MSGDGEKVAHKNNTFVVLAPKGGDRPANLREDLSVVAALAMRPTEYRGYTRPELHRRMCTMLISRFNGVLRFHCVDTIARRC
jgi:hypothetical protein